MTWTSVEWLEAVIGQAPGYAVLLEGPELRIKYANGAAQELMGRLPIGQSVREMFAGTKGLASVEQAYATGKTVTIRETPPQVPDPRHTGRYIDRTYTPLKDASGKVRGVLVTGRDVTAEVYGRRAKEENEQRSRAELERTFLLFEEAPVMLGVLEPPDWTLTIANRGLRSLISGRVQLGAPLRPLLPPSSATLATVERVYSTGRPESFETVSRLPGFEGRAFSISFVAVPSGDGTISHVMAAAVEVTEQRRARQELAAQARDLELARQEAVAAGRAKDQFLAMLGHELRNPLQPMLTAVQVMRLDGDTSPSLDMLEREVLYLTQLVDDLLDVSRISRGMITLKLESLDIRSIINRGLELASPLLEQRKHHVIIDVEQRSLGVSGDLQRLAQVISNLIQNAAKYSPPASQIRITANRVDDRIVVKVADDGVGMEPELIGRVFDAFVQGAQPLARSGGGLGIGLAIVKSFVEAHGGVVTAHSDGPGRGSTFVVELPAIDYVPDHTTPSAQRRVSRERDVAAIRILVVDDNIEAADILEMALTAVGHHVAVAYDGPSALEVAKTIRPQIALLDIGLPVMDGYELAELLRASFDIPFVAITGYGQAVDRERSHAAGFAEHLVKPVDLAALVELVEKLTGSR